MGVLHWLGARRPRYLQPSPRRYQGAPAGCHDPALTPPPPGLASAPREMGFGEWLATVTSFEFDSGRGAIQQEPDRAIAALWYLGPAGCLCGDGELTLYRARSLRSWTASAKGECLP